VVDNPRSLDEYPYGVHAAVLRGSDIELQEDGAEGGTPAVVEMRDGRVLRLDTHYTPPSETARNLKRVALTLDAFTSASGAEAAGDRLTISVLWTAISKGFSVAFPVRTGSAPYRVYDRAVAPGTSVHGEGRVYWPLTSNELLGRIASAFDSNPPLDPALHTSMELFAASGTEVSEQTRFVVLVTALEALCVQRDLGPAVGERLEAAVRGLGEIGGEQGESVRNSLAGQIRALRRESVRKAIVRTLHEFSIADDRIDAVDEAYAARSKLLHEGARIRDPSTHARTVENVLRDIYSARFRQPV